MSLSTENNGECAQCDFEAALQRLRSVPLFAKLPLELMKGLAFLANRLNFQQGENLITQGDPAEEGFYLAQGEVEVVRAEGGDERILGSWQAPRLLGGLALYGGYKWLFSVRAKGPVAAFSINRRKFLQHLGQNPASMEHFFEAAARAVASWEETRLQENRGVDQRDLSQVGVSLL